MTKLYSVAFPTKNKFEGTNTFVYSSKKNLGLGDLVVCPFGKKSSIGVVVELDSPEPKFKYKEVTEIVIRNFISPVNIELFNWLSEYYAANSGVTLELFCTNILINRIIQRTDHDWLEKQNIKPKDQKKLNRLNKYQSSALDEITKSKNSSFVLHGATGSGKTEVYLHTAKKNLKENRSVLVLVPEIGLTTQNISRFEDLGVPLISLHSKQTAVARAKNWQIINKLTKEGKPIVVLGPRSAMFSPINNLGLIIIDEFHDQSYKQDSSPRYNSVIVGGMLAKLTKSKLILGSATPNVADLYTLSQKNVPILELPSRDSQTKDISLIDSRDKDNFTRSKIISSELLGAIKESMNNLDQSMIFHNRRGSARMQLCSNTNPVCDWINSCPNCHIPMVFHADEYNLRCHTCGHRSKPELICPICSSETLNLRGYGTKHIVSELEKIFPDARIARFDADNTTKESTLENNFEKLKKGEVDIIVGTQMLAKGLDLPKLSLVGIIQAESGLSMPDFRSSERTFQLITQVIGRVGRGHTHGKVIIQSFAPEHPAVKLASEENYQEFYKNEIEERKLSLTPPFRYQLKLTGRYSTEDSAIRASNLLSKEIRDKIKSPLPHIIGPSPAFRERVGGKYQYQLIIKSTRREQLQEIIRNHLPTNWTADIDPLSLL